MTSPMVDEETLLERIGEMRAAGLTPKQISRALGLRPAQVAPLMRTTAARAAASAGEALVGCWVSRGWSGGLGVSGRPDWLDLPPGEHLGPPLEAPLELARHLVYGAVDAARRLGFDPATDFAAAAGHLGHWDDQSAITFGRDGLPCHVQGPYDDAAAVLRTLKRTVGEGNFHYMIAADALATG